MAEKVKNPVKKGDIIIVQVTRASTKLHGETTRTTEFEIRTVARAGRDGSIKAVADEYGNAREVAAWGCLTVPDIYQKNLRPHLNKSFPALTIVQDLAKKKRGVSEPSDY